MIAKEVIRIDIDLFDDSAQSQLNDTPIMPGRAPAARLPAVHPFAAIGILVRNEDSAARFQKIFFLGEKFVIREERHCRRRAPMPDQQDRLVRILASRSPSFNCRDMCCRPMEKRAAERDIWRTDRK